ncbi:hypothetical protein [Rugosimonospora africana]|uniref:Uncharacterized protein n=1 Tax=Rugosimonospora africana TaxID=556532 RepID=A0A8J3QTK8_9ACTN|nr:hypothetical protein [Rugosimonospora africana]GIH15742.1 hypothetical protein Raf01_39140 [Rugosimonospora africana]
MTHHTADIVVRIVIVAGMVGCFGYAYLAGRDRGARPLPDGEPAEPTVPPTARRHGDPVPLRRSARRHHTGACAHTVSRQATDRPGSS